MSDAKTEEPTPRRERKARSEGRAWQSRDLTLGAVLALTGVLVRVGAEGTLRGLERLFTTAIARAEAGVAPGAALEASFSEGTALVLPWLLGVVVIGALVSAVQVGGVFAPGVLSPDAGRIDPSSRFDGDAGPRLAMRWLLGLARLALLISVVIATFVQAMPGIATLSRQPASAALDACFTLASALTLRAGIALFSFGVLDAIVERALHRASLRMTKREREREQREAEGDAHVRRERERVREELARADDLEEARTATLVVSDDELAVALAYDASDLDAVPRVAAIAHGERADALLAEARERGVRCVTDAELAARLAILALGAVIPESLYEPVARAMPTDAA